MTRAKWPLILLIVTPILASLVFEQSLANAVLEHHWKFVFILGALCLLLFLWDYRKASRLDPSHLWLLVLAIGLLLVGVFKPPVLELGGAKIQLERVTAAATTAETAANNAEKAKVLLTEMTAVALWNSACHAKPYLESSSAELDDYMREQQKMARNLLSNIFGSDAGKVIRALQKKRILCVERGRMISDGSMPAKYLSQDYRFQSEVNQMLSWTLY